MHCGEKWAGKIGEIFATTLGSGGVQGQAAAKDHVCVQSHTISGVCADGCGYISTEGYLDVSVLCCHLRP